MGEFIVNFQGVNPRFLQFKGFKLLLQTIITQYLATVQELILWSESHGLLWPQWHMSVICNVYTQVASLVYRLMHFIESTIRL